MFAKERPAGCRGHDCWPASVLLAQFAPQVRPSVVARVASVDEASPAVRFVLVQQTSPVAQVRFALVAPASLSEASLAALAVHAASNLQVALALQPVPLARDTLALLVAVVRDAPAVQRL